MRSTISRRRLRRLLTAVLLLSLVASLGGVAYVATTPDTDDPYTEFYMLGSNGVAADYPTELSVGESGAFVVGITNNEQGDQTYTVAVVDGALVEQQTVDVAAGETWEDEFTVSFGEPGTHEVRILLFADDSVGSLDEPYRELRLQSAVRP